MTNDLEHIYSKWLNNELSDDELTQLKESGDLEILNLILSETNSWELPDTKSSFQELQEKIQKRKNKTRIFSLYKKVAVAASLIILVTVGYFLYSLYTNEVMYETSFGETRKIELPDNTKIILSGNSSLSYYSYDWENNRKVNITGKVYFDINRKGDFDVHFNGGSVSVKGTAFEILATDGYQVVKCYRGHVVAKMGDQEFDLTAGKGVDSDHEEFTFDENETDKDDKYTAFKNVKLIEVLKSMSLQFGYKFENTEKYLNKRFTGRYINSNGQKSLNMIFTPLGIKYTLKDKKVILE